MKIRFRLRHVRMWLIACWLFTLLEQLVMIWTIFTEVGSSSIRSTSSSWKFSSLTWSQVSWSTGSEAWRRLTAWETRTRRTNATFAQWKNQMYFIGYLDLKDWNNFQKTHREALLVELSVLQICGLNERCFRLYRSIIHYFHANRRKESGMVPWQRSQRGEWRNIDFDECY